MFRRIAGLFVVSMAVGVAPAYATLLDLTTTGASGTGTNLIGGLSFFVQQISPQSTGTGVIDPFVRVQASGEEDGYNTSLGVPLDDKAGTWTHALLLADVPIVTLGGVQYRQFLLDINEDSGSSHELLSLNQIQIFQRNGDMLHTSYAPNTSPGGSNPIIGFSGATEIFRFNNASKTNDNEIRMNYDLNSGSGSGDMFLYVRNSAFNVNLTNVIFYSQFGYPAGYASSSDGFEEWAVLRSSACTGPGCVNVNAVPEPTTLLLLGSGLGLVARMRRKNRK